MENYDEIRASVIKTTVLPTKEEQDLALERIKRLNSLFLRVNYSGEPLPALIKKLAIMPCSARYMSAVFHPKRHSLHGHQYEGRDLKRWAAIELNELFKEEAIIKEHRLENFVGEFWHE